MKFTDFTKIELDQIKELANFTDEEERYLDLRAKGKSIVEISMLMNISTSKVSLLSRRVREKYLKIEKYCNFSRKNV